MLWATGPDHPCGVLLKSASSMFRISPANENERQPTCPHPPLPGRVSFKVSPLHSDLAAVWARFTPAAGRCLGQRDKGVVGMQGMLLSEGGTRNIICPKPLPPQTAPCPVPGVLQGGNPNPKLFPPLCQGPFPAPLSKIVA